MSAPGAPSQRFAQALLAILTENGVPDRYGWRLKHTTEPLNPIVDE